MNKETGGPAFPLHQHGTQTLGMHITGMTLRDYFAAKAMATMLPNYDIPSLFEEILDEGDKSMPDLIAIDAYVMADAMLEARKCKK